MLTAILLFLVIIFVSLAIFSFMGGGSGEGERIRDRLLGKGVKAKVKKVDPAESAQLIKTEEPQTSISVKLLKRFELAERVQTLIEQSGLRWTAAGLVQGALGAALVVFNLCWYLAPYPFDRFAWVVAMGAFSLPFLYVKRQAKKRISRFEEQFPESLEFVARSMRAGHAFSVSLEMIHREFSEPLAGEFRRTFDEQNLGLPLEIALQNLGKRVPLLEVQFFISAVLLQKRTGGNLAELLDKLAILIRERFKLRGRIRAVSAHGRLTARALSCIPFGTAALMFITNPEYIGFFVKDETGHIMAGIALTLQLLGYLIMQKIVNIEV
jgi:tight adherence protein B